MKRAGAKAGLDLLLISQPLGPFLRPDRPCPSLDRDVGSFSTPGLATAHHGLRAARQSVCRGLSTLSFATAGCSLGLDGRTGLFACPQRCGEAGRGGRNSLRDVPFSASEAGAARGGGAFLGGGRLRRDDRRGRAPAPLRNGDRTTGAASFRTVRAPAQLHAGTYGGSPPLRCVGQSTALAELAVLATRLEVTR